MKINARSFKYLFVFLLPYSVFLSCNKISDDDKEKLQGKFINQTFLNQIPDSIAGLVQAYCYEMDFVSEDSVKIMYGFEEATLAYKKQGSHYVLSKALQNKDMRFELNENGAIILNDSAWNESHQNSVFTRSKVKSDKWDIENYINQRMIAGSYTLYKDDQPTSQKITFSPEGTVTGLEGFTSYNICYSGDCVGETYPISNNITFTSDQKSSSVYAFEIDSKSKALKINNIEASIPDTKGERAIKDLAFDLRKN